STLGAFYRRARTAARQSAAHAGTALLARSPRADVVRVSTAAASRRDKPDRGGACVARACADAPGTVQPSWDIPASTDPVMAFPAQRHESLDGPSPTRNSLRAPLRKRARACRLQAPSAGSDRS